MLLFLVMFFVSSPAYNLNHLAHLLIDFFLSFGLADWDIEVWWYRSKCKKIVVYVYNFYRDLFRLCILKLLKAEVGHFTSNLSFCSKWR